MTKKTRTSQQQRARQEQWRRRVETRSTAGGATATRPAAPDELELELSADGEAEAMGVEIPGGEYRQVDLRPAPSNVATSSATARSLGRSGGASTLPTPTASQRRAVATGRATRTRLAMNTMSLEEEMHYVRADIRKLVILTAACLAVIIVLALVLNM